MNRAEQNPFEMLSGIPVPDTDPRKMEETVRRSTETFARTIVRQEPVRPQGIWERLRIWIADHANRLVPAAAGVCAVAIGAIVFMPALRDRLPLPSGAGDSVILSRERSPGVADEHVAPPGSTMGMRPAPQPPTADPQSRPQLERYSFGDLQLGVINQPGTVAIYLIEGNIQRQLEIAGKDADLRGVITDAFTYEVRAETVQLLLIRFRIGESEGWKAFARSGSGYSFSSEMTAIVENADSREEAVRRLDSNP